MISRIMWSIEVPHPELPTEVLALSRETLLTHANMAALSCREGLRTGFELSESAASGITDSFAGSHLFVNGGTETEKSTLHAGTVGCDFYNFESGEKVQIKDRPNPEIKISTEGLAQEVMNLRTTAKSVAGKELREGFAGETIARVDELLDDSSSLLEAAVRMASARRLLKYVILPQGLLTKAQRRSIGFESWLDAMSGRFLAGGVVIDDKMIKVAEKMYVSEDIAIKNLRRTAWSSIFFNLLGVNEEDFMFYVLYRNVVASNCGRTVTFSNPLSTLLPKEEATKALEKIFARPKPKLRIVESKA